MSKYLDLTDKYLDVKNGKAGFCEYEMLKSDADGLLKSREGEDRNMNSQDYLCKFVNEEYGLMKFCTRVLTYEE